MLQSEVKYTHEWICLQIQKEKYITLMYTEEIKIMEGTLSLVWTNQERAPPVKTYRGITKQNKNNITNHYYKTNYNSNMKITITIAIWQYDSPW